MQRRASLVFVTLTIFLFAVVIRLFSWQILSAEKLQGLAQAQTQRSSAITAKRGRIYFSDGSPLVLNQKAFQVFAQPDQLSLSHDQLKLISKSLAIDEATISSKIENKKLKWVALKEKVDPTEIEQLYQSSIKGIGFSEISKRYYPESSMAAHILGFVGKNAQGEDQGYFGLEGYYDALLRGQEGLRTQEADVQGFPILLGERQDIPAQNGRDLVLSIDRTVQFIAETKLKEGITKYGAKGATVIIMEPQTGEILAMAGYPSYDPADYEHFPTSFYKNPTIAGSFEPGSTFKVLVMGAAIEKGSIAADTKFDEGAPLEISDYTIRTWNNKYHGFITTAQILEYSSNVGMVLVSQKIGKDTLLQYIERLGVGSATEIDLQEESSPQLRDKNKWYEIDYATASFGQGIAVTPLQMVRAVAAFANGGMLVQPHIVTATKLSDGTKIPVISPTMNRVFSNETSAIITEMMVAAVENGETKYLKQPHMRIAGKTGTAQIPIAGHYDSEKTIASFVGFGPADSPRFVMLVTVVEPTTSPWGSETAAPIFFNIAKELFYYWGISPS